MPDTDEEWKQYQVFRETADSEEEMEKIHRGNLNQNLAGRRTASVERLKEETRLVLLDFLGALPPEKLTARNLTVSEHRPERLKQALKLSKSPSDAASYENRRQKFQNMAAPLRRKLSLNLKQEIENFDRRSQLRKSPTSPCAPKFRNRPNNLNIQPHYPEHHVLPSPVLSPEGRVAAMLDKIGQEIMESYPHLLDESMEITKDWDLRCITYEDFQAAARKVTLDNKLVGWSKVALLCFFAREIAMECSEELDDKELIQLAEYTVRFIEETTGEWIERQGGWAGIELEEDIILNAESLAVKYREHHENSPEERKLRQARRISGRRSNRNSGINTDTSSWNNWAKYGIAAIAVGMGVCYSMIRH
ncbi:uncharacterized protein LOC5508275 [Nematostella vectensis]|uniref:uncharacterized protein LOC5508275 n=1 Tax=Nematostella vectensis TaxID=45351 RepID=UPI0013906C9C|nr:uncharacterized protein LOC5508275 [Nematostella vectensis]